MAVGIVYHPVYLRHETDGHPESAERLVAVVDALLKRGYLSGGSGRLSSGTSLLLHPSAVPLELLMKTHTAALIEHVRHVAENGGGWMDPDTIVSPHSYDAALHAAGAMLCGLDAIYAGTVDKVFALVRPPGHHATRDASMGFCLFNNIAVAAQYAFDRYAVRKILIVDWDLHHGNGTQGTFYQDPRVLYFSVHQYPYYPGTGAVSERGTGAGAGYTVNVPFPSGVGDAGFLRAFSDVLVPVTRRFKPELVLVSAGYDAHRSDPLGSLNVTEAGFFAMARTVQMLADEFCSGRMLLTLEGGYDLRALGQSVVASLEALEGMPETSIEPGVTHVRERAEQLALEVIEQVRLLHRLA